MEDRLTQVQRWLLDIDAKEILYLAVRLGPFISSKELFATDNGYLVWHAIDDTGDQLTREALAEKLNAEWKHWEPDPRFDPSKPS